MSRCLLWIVAIVAIVSLPTPWIRGESSLSQSHAERSMIRVSPISDTFATQMELAARSVPSHVWYAVMDAGWRVYLAEQVVDAVPALRGVAPRGWPAGTLWDNTDAVHLPASKQLVVAEKRRNRRGEVVSCTRVAGVLRHELGHAFDMVAGQDGHFRSASADFLAAYHGDVAEMTAVRREKLQYYLQPQDAGRQETFAEAFGIVLGGGSDPDHREVFTTGFTRSLKLVRDAIGEHGAPRPSVATADSRHVPVPSAATPSEFRASGPLLRRWR
ncbi:MAG: hypothetical protein AB7F89_14535 [Pirellulaceae bacterium]